MGEEVFRHDGDLTLPQSQARIDAEGRIEQERKNRDIRDAQLVLQAEETRKTGKCQGG